jgi:hypothetical protein
MIVLKSKYILPVLLLLGVVFSSCLKEDDKVTPHQPGPSTIGNVNMGTNYKFQYYYDLETNTVVGQHLKDIWDIGYDSNPDGHAIVLNGANFAKIWRTGETDFAAVTDTMGASWRADDNSGRLDSTAIGEWGVEVGDSIISNGQVYLIDRGYDVSFNRIGFVKMKIDGANASGVKITWANLDGTGLSSMFITKEPDYNFGFASLNASGTMVDVEPLKTAWDIVFTQYVFIYRNIDFPYYPYLVTGALHNRSGVETAADSSGTQYESIAIADTSTMDFMPNLDVIGYDWKYYDFNTALYAIKPNKNFVVRSRNNRYFKLRFTDFYKDGIKGNIVFEFQEL